MLAFGMPFMLSLQDHEINPELPGILRFVDTDIITLYYQFIRGKLKTNPERLKRAYELFELDQNVFDWIAERARFARRGVR